MNECYKYFEDVYVLFKWYRYIIIYYIGVDLNQSAIVIHLFFFVPGNVFLLKTGFGVTCEKIKYIVYLNEGPYTGQ